MSYPPFQLERGFGRRQKSSHQMGFVSKLDPFFELVEEVISQVQRIAFVGFDHAYWSRLNRHHIHGNVEFLEILD